METGEGVEARRGRDLLGQLPSVSSFPSSFLFSLLFSSTHKVKSLALFSPVQRYQ